MRWIDRMGAYSVLQAPQQVDAVRLVFSLTSRAPIVPIVSWPVLPIQQVF